MEYETRVTSESINESIGYEAQVVAEKKGLFHRRIGSAILKTFDVDSQRKINGPVQLQVVKTNRKYRGQGVGRAVVEEAVNLAKSRGASQVELNSVDNAVEFYQKLGFTLKDKQTGKMVKQLENSADSFSDAV